MGYQGYANWETWNVALWVDNEEPWYLKKVRLLKRSDEPIAGENVKELVDGYMGGSTPDFGYSETAEAQEHIAKVNWSEIAEMWELERQETILYDLAGGSKYRTVDDYLDDKTAEVQALLAPYDLGIDDEEIRELILEEEGDLDAVVEVYTEDLAPPQDDQPVNLDAFKGAI